MHALRAVPVIGNQPVKMADERVHRVEQIGRQEEEDGFGSLSPLWPTASPSHTLETLQARVEKWTEETGEKACAIVYVATECFHVHKSAISRCGYLKRQLTNASVVTVNPPLTIAPTTFLTIAHFCYGAEIIISPHNLAALRTAAELLEMTEAVDRGNLLAQAEKYFVAVVGFDQDHATVVLNECVALMPEAETAGSLPSRCLRVLGMFREGDMLAERVQAVRLMAIEDFKVVARKLREILVAKHDTLYIVVDQYIKGNMEKLTEEDRSELCALIDCVRVDSQLLTHTAQCHRMPLNFVVRAMFADQIKTRNSSNVSANGKPPQMLKGAPKSAAALEMETTLRKVEKIKEEMEITSARIKLLEEEIKDMRAALTESKPERVEIETNKVDARRSVSMRMLTTVAQVNMVRRCERGSVSSGAMRLSRIVETTPSPAGYRTHCGGKGFGAKLMSRLKSVFRASGPKEEKEAAGFRVGRRAQFSPI